MTSAKQILYIWVSNGLPKTCVFMIFWGKIDVFLMFPIVRNVRQNAPHINQNSKIREIKQV